MLGPVQALLPRCRGGSCATRQLLAHTIRGKDRSTERSRQCCGNGRLAGTTQTGHGYECRPHGHGIRRSKVQVLGGFEREVVPRHPVGEGAAEASDLGTDQRPVRLVEAEQALGHIEASRPVAGGERASCPWLPETVKVHEQKGEVACYVGAAQRAAELNTVKDLNCTVRLEADVFGP